jgi:GT2 family glycosyltransferase
LEYLKILLRSIKRNTKITHEVIVHDNGSEDGTEEWLKQNNVKYSRSATNEGVAAVNYAVRQAQFSHIIDINADMFVLPGWDTEILKQILFFKQNEIDRFTISSCLIEPYGDNPEYNIAYHGHNPQTFDEEGLMRDYLQNIVKTPKINTIQYSHPVSMPKKLWKEFGGVDTDYFPGYASDHDIAARAYNVGCRNFCMLGKSRVYHFISQTLGKLSPSLRAQNGHAMFQKKCGLTVEEFRSKIGIRNKFEVIK